MSVQVIENLKQNKTEHDKDFLNKKIISICWVCIWIEWSVYAGQIMRMCVGQVFRVYGQCFTDR